MGHPIHHSRSPFIHAAFAHQTAQDLRYDAFDVPPEQLAAMVRDFFAGGGGGLNLTLPHKESAARLVDELTPRAALAGAVNTITTADGRLLGDNTDGAGLLRDLRVNLGLYWTRPRILLLGAGGAARGIVAPLLQLQPRALVIANRTPARALALAEHYRALGPVAGKGLDELAGPSFDLIVNATAASLEGQVPPVPEAALGPDTTCYDLAYATGETAFQRWARERGAAHAEQGLGMLVEQAAEAFELWRGIRPATGPVLQALRAQLSPAT